MNEETYSYISKDEIIQVTGQITKHIDTENWTRSEEKGWYPDLQAMYSDQAQQTTINSEYLQKVTQITEQVPNPCTLQFTVQEDKPLVIEVIDQVNKGGDGENHMGFIMIAPIVDQ